MSCDGCYSVKVANVVRAVNVVEVVKLSNFHLVYTASKLPHHVIWSVSQHGHTSVMALRVNGVMM